MTLGRHHAAIKPVLVHHIMHTRTRLYRGIWLTSVLCWALVFFMPVLNAHSSVQGVWENLCTLNGLKLVKIDDGKPELNTGKPCPFAHFSSFHYQAVSPQLATSRFHYISLSDYGFVAIFERFKQPVSRAPPPFLVT